MGAVRYLFYENCHLTFSSFINPFTHLLYFHLICKNIRASGAGGAARYAYNNKIKLCHRSCSELFSATPGSNRGLHVGNPLSVNGVVSNNSCPVGTPFKATNPTLDHNRSHPSGQSNPPRKSTWLTKEQKAAIMIPNETQQVITGMILS